MKLTWRHDDRRCMGLYVGQCRIGGVETYDGDDKPHAWLQTGEQKETQVFPQTYPLINTIAGCMAALEPAARRALENDEILEPDELAALLNGDVK